MTAQVVGVKVFVSAETWSYEKVQPTTLNMALASAREHAATLGLTVVEDGPTQTTVHFAKFVESDREDGLPNLVYCQQGDATTVIILAEVTAE